jgi:hypothetical protein
VNMRVWNVHRWLFVVHWLYIQAVLEALAKGQLSSAGDTRLNKLVDLSLLEGYESSMFLDAATVFHGQESHAALCAWAGMYPNDAVAHGFKLLQDYSYIKIKINESKVGQYIWVHDIIVAIVEQKANAENTRVWRADQVFH